MLPRFYLAIAATMVAAIQPSARADEDVSIVVDPRTGAASIRNDTASSIELDGYLLRAGTDLFDPVGWNSLDEQGVSGWIDGPAAPNRLGDTNLFGSTSLAGGATFNLGTPYTPFTPSVIGEREPLFDFTYNVPGVGSFSGDVEFINQNNVVLVVDPSTGAASLENQSLFDIEIDSYLITSTVGALSTSGWGPLADSDSAWFAASGASNRIAEGNLLSATPLSSNGGSLSLGSPIDPAVLTDEVELSLRYNVPGLGQITGGVVFASLAVSDLPGDYNNDGVVNAADYTVWRDGAAPNSGPAGYDLWADNYGQTAFSASSTGSAGTAIPEPSSALLLLLFALAPSLARRS